MPVGQRDEVTYFSVAYGKLRIKTDKDNPEAVHREFEGKESWAIEYAWIEGKIVRIYYKESKEFGNSYEVRISDGHALYNVSLKEGSRYCHDFLTKLPNIDLDNWVKLTPYSMTKDDKERRGLSVQQGGEKIQNFFCSKVEEAWIYREGFPEMPNKKLSDKEMKVYWLMVQQFLYEYTLPIIEALNKDEFDRQLDEHKQNQLQAGPPIVDDDTYYKQTDENDSNLPF